MHVSFNDNNAIQRIWKRRDFKRKLFTNQLSITVKIPLANFQVSITVTIDQDLYGSITGMSKIFFLFFSRDDDDQGSRDTFQTHTVKSQ